MPAVHGENHPAAKLTEEKVRAIRAAIATGKSMRDIAVEFGTSASTVAKIHTGLVWRHLK